MKILGIWIYLDHNVIESNKKEKKKRTFLNRNQKYYLKIIN